MLTFDIEVNISAKKKSGNVIACVQKQIYEKPYDHTQTST